LIDLDIGVAYASVSPFVWRSQCSLVHILCISNLFAHAQLTHN